jgi:hypothetical protein
VEWFQSGYRRIARTGIRLSSPLAACTLAALSRQFCLGRLELVAKRGELDLGQRNHISGPQILAASCCFLVTGRARLGCCQALVMAVSDWPRWSHALC